MSALEETFEAIVRKVVREELRCVLTDKPEELLDAEGVAVLLKVNKQKVYSLAREGELEPIMLSKRDMRWAERMSKLDGKGGYEVVGPNTSDYRESRWFFPSLADARRFAEHIATEVDAPYDIYLHVARVRQKPLEPRPLVYSESPVPEEPPDSYARMGRVDVPVETLEQQEVSK